MNITCADILSDIEQVIVLSVCVCVNERCVVLCGGSDLHCELLKQKGQTNVAS